MEPITRNVRDIETGERQVLEHVLGRQLREDQQVIIQVVTPALTQADSADAQSSSSFGALPPWCNVYEGLREDEIDDIEQVILQRANLTRPSE